MKRDPWIVALLVALALTLSASGTSRKYAPQRCVDILHTRIDVTPDFESRRVAGVTDITFTPIVVPLRELVLDACDLEVEAIWSDRPLSAWHAEDDRIAVTFEQAVRADERVTVHVRYQAEPKRGLYFRTPELGYPAEGQAKGSALDLAAAQK